MDDMEFEDSDAELISDSDSDESSSDEENLSGEESDVEDNENINTFSNDYFSEINLNSALDPPLPRFKFTETPGVKINLENEDNVLEYFEYFWDDDIMNTIVTETNRYAEDCFRKKKFSSHWSPINKEEIFVFFALHILQGIVNKPIIEWYWSKKPSIETPFFSKILPHKRFAVLKRYMHFVDNSTDVTNHPNLKLNKIWPVFQHLNQKFSSALVPERDISIDESLMLFKGKLGWKQYIPVKRAGFGIKSFVLCEAKSGYVWSSIMYTETSTEINENFRDFTIPTQIVMTLMTPLLEKGYCVVTDSYYTSPELANILIQYKTDTFGTLRLHKKEVPKELQQKKLKKGQMLAYRKGKICILKWKDNRDMCILSTIHNPEMVKVHHRKTTKIKPKAILDYNNNMGGVDRADQLLTNYLTMKKRGKKYYHKIFMHLLDQTVLNTFILYQKKGGTKSHLVIRLQLVDLLIEKYNKNVSRPGRSSLEPHPSRLSERHFLEIIPPNKKENPCRSCKVCCSKKDAKGKRIRKETRYYCKDCDVGLCIPCFKIYHTQNNY